MDIKKYVESICEITTVTNGDVLKDRSIIVALENLVELIAVESKIEEFNRINELMKRE